MRIFADYKPDTKKILIIRRHVLNSNGFLFEEPLYLLEKEVKDPVSYLSIMKAIASGNRKLSEIASVLELKANK